MNEEQIALARRAVACRGWRWMPGMRARGCGDSGVVTNVWCDPDTHQTTDIYVSYDEECRSCLHTAPGYDQCLPDLSDPATLGCLLALVRSAWRDRYASVWCDTQFSTWEDRWVYSADGTTKTGFSTEAEALVYALEAAP
jgi:hypothetical protein